MGAAAAYLSQKHHLRGAGNTSWRSGGFPGPQREKFGFSEKSCFLNLIAHQAVYTDPVPRILCTGISKKRPPLPKNSEI